MLQALFTTLEQWPFAVSLRGSTWSYPLVNAAHILGLALLFGSIVPLDLRLAGFWPSLALEPLRRLLLPVAIAGLSLAAASGLLLFAAKATEYAASWWFLGKISLVGLALANALLLRFAAAWKAGRESAWTRLAGLASMALWAGAIVLGRLVGYF